MRLTQQAQELEAELDVERQAANDLKKMWQDAVDRIDKFAQDLATQQPKTCGAASSNLASSEVSGDGAPLALPSDGSVHGVHLHPEMRSGLRIISEELWGTAPGQQDREMGRVASWIWGTQCMLLQIFRFYAGRNNGVAVLLGEEDWRRFVEDCRIQTATLPSSGTYKSATAAVFDHFKWHEAKKPGKNRTNNPAEDYALTAFEFFVAVVELAGRVVAAELANASDMLLSQRVGKFLEKHIECYVPRSDSAVLEATIDSKSVRQFFDEHKKALRNVFMVFCKADESELSNLDRINRREFEELVLVCKMDKTAGLNTLRTRKLFNNAVGLAASAALAEQIETTIAASPGLQVGTRELRAAPAKPVAFALAGEWAEQFASYTGLEQREYLCSTYDVLVLCVVCTGEDCDTLFGAANKPSSPCDAIMLSVGLQLSFEDFCLAFCMLALARYADVMLPMQHKLKQFFDGDFALARKTKKVSLR